MTSNAPAPAKTIYEGLDPTKDLSRVNGDPIFGFHPKIHDVPKSFLFDYAHSDRSGKGDHKDPISKLPYPQYDRAVTLDDIAGLQKAAANQEIFITSKRLSAAVMNSTRAFPEISKQDFAKAYVAAIQQPQCAGFYAVIAMGRHVVNARESAGIGFGGVNVAKREEYPELNKQVSELASVAYNHANSNPSNFLMSGQYFRAGDWEKAPLTADEILAMPFVLGEIPEVYAEVEHDLGRHAESCAKKLESAGYPEIAAYITQKFELDAVASKPQRKHEDPGFGM
jgi:hypothetical protein